MVVGDVRLVFNSVRVCSRIVQSAVTVSTTTDNSCEDPSVSDFTIHARSANAPVSVTVIHAPDSAAAKIDVVATSSYAPVVVSLDPMFEGTFSLSSGIGADFDEDDNIPDPLGEILVSYQQGSGIC